MRSRITPLVFFLLLANWYCPLCAQSNLSHYLNDKIWNRLFPNRSDLTYSKKDFYSFKAFLQAAEAYPGFLSSPDTAIQKRELCAFLANIAYETGGGWAEAPGGYYAWGLYNIEELNCEKGCPQYSDTVRKNYPPQTGRSYHGRGPLQLSWNYNYGQFSESFFKDKDKLLNEPSLVSSDPVVCFASALWFWTSTQYPKPSCHDIITDNWVPTQKDLDAGRQPGFGAVVNVINGGIECGKISGDTKYRYGYYLFFCKYFHADPGANIECSTQRPFGR